MPDEHPELTDLHVAAAPALATYLRAIAPQRKGRGVRDGLMVAANELDWLMVNHNRARFTLPADLVPAFTALHLYDQDTNPVTRVPLGDWPAVVTSGQAEEISVWAAHDLVPAVRRHILVLSGLFPPVTGPAALDTVLTDVLTELYQAATALHHAADTWRPQHAEDVNAALHAMIKLLKELPGDLLATAHARQHAHSAFAADIGTDPDPARFSVNVHRQRCPLAVADMFPLCTADELLAALRRAHEAVKLRMTAEAIDARAEAWRNPPPGAHLTKTPVVMACERCQPFGRDTTMHVQHVTQLANLRTHTTTRFHNAAEVFERITNGVRATEHTHLNQPPADNPPATP